MTTAVQITRLKRVRCRSMVRARTCGLCWAVRTSAASAAALFSRAARVGDTLPVTVRSLSVVGQRKADGTTREWRLIGLVRSFPRTIPGKYSGPDRSKDVGPVRSSEGGEIE